MSVALLTEDMVTKQLSVPNEQSEATVGKEKVPDTT